MLTNKLNYSYYCMELDLNKKDISDETLETYKTLIKMTQPRQTKLDIDHMYRYDGNKRVYLYDKDGVNIDNTVYFRLDTIEIYLASYTESNIKHFTDVETGFEYIDIIDICDGKSLVVLNVFEA